MVLVIGQGLKLVIDEGFARGQERAPRRRRSPRSRRSSRALGVLTWFRVYNVYWIGARFTADLRQRVYDHLLTLSPGFYEEARTGEVASRVTNDVTLIEAVMGGTLLYALRMAITHGRLRRDALLHQREAHGAGARRHADRAAADRPPRAARAQALARGAGPRGRRVQPRGRDAARDPHGAGLRARAPRERDLRRARERGVRAPRCSAPATSRSSSPR